MRWREVGRTVVAGLVLSAPVQAQDREVIATTITIGGALDTPSGSSVRLKGLGTSGGTYVLLGDATDGGNIRSRLLGVTDIPSAFTRDDVAEAITQPWTWSAAVPQLRWYESDQSANERQWIALVNDKAWMLRAYTDDAGSSVPILTAQRGAGTAMTSLTLHPRVIFGEHLYPTTGYTSDLAQPSAKMRSLHAAEMFIETIVAQERITTMGGRFTVTPSNVLTRDIDASATTICVKYNSFLLHVGGVEYGSKIALEKAGQFEAMYVTSLSTPSVDGTYGDYCYTVLRNQDGSGANSWTAGDGIIDTGKIGSGMIDQFAVRGLTSSNVEGPSIDFLLRTNGGWPDLSHRASIGNLNGRYGYSADTWGLAAGDPAATYITAEATNGFRILGPSNTVKFHAKTNGDIDLSGNVNLVTGGDVRSAGNFSLTAGSGLTFEQSSGSSGDAPRSIRWASGGSIFSYLASGVTPTLTMSSTDVRVTANSDLRLQGYMASFPVGFRLTNNVIEITGGVSDTPVLRPDGDSEWTLGSPSYRFKNVHLNLGTAITNGTNVVVLDPTDTTRFKQMAGWSGTCSAASFTVQGGIITSC